jgi:putative sterol carrier protein
VSDNPQPLDASTVDPEEFAESIGQTPDTELRDGMEGPLREQILAEIFRRMERHFKGGGEDAVIHWTITGRADGGEDHWEVVIKDGKCTTTPGGELDPRVTLKLDGVDFLKLVTGNANGPMLFMSGKLKVEGDLMFSTQIQSMFTIPG